MSMASAHSSSASQPLTLALDAMGGDDAPEAVITGAAMAHREHSCLQFRLFGDEAKIQPILKQYQELANVCEVIHTQAVISSEEKPSNALRRGKNSSMRLAIDDVASGNAVGVVSGGNTGALMAMSKIVFRTLPGVDRPAITATIPTQKRDCVMLDMGANLECDAHNLFQFAVMGEAFCRAVLGYDQPTIGIVNVGTEELKGHDYLREAAEMLRNSPLAGQFKGFIEGNDITRGTVDVVITDGFTGNVVLKTAEGVAQFCTSELKQALKHSLVARIGGLLSLRGLHGLKKRLDPRLRNGGMFVGLNGIAVKSHGGSDALGFAHAIIVAMHIAQNDLNTRIIEDLQAFDATASAKAAAV